MMRPFYFRQIRMFCLFLLTICFTTSIVVAAEPENLIDKSEKKEIGFKIGDSSLPSFVIDRFDYLYYLPYSTEKVPNVKAYGFEEARVRVKQARKLQGTKQKRTAYVQVKQNGKTDTYRIEFAVMPEMDIYIAIGQSNMAGRGEMIDSLGDMDPISGAWLFDNTGNWVPASNPMNRYSAIRKPLHIQGISPSYMCAKVLAEQTKRPIGMVVNARGATKLEAWQKGAKSKYYAKTVQRALEAQKWGKIRGIIWHQGEGNVGSAARIENYLPQLARFVSDLRKDLGNDSLYFVAGELARWQIGKNNLKERKMLFNEKLGAIQQVIPFSDKVSSDGEGFAPIRVNGVPDYEDPHFDRRSQFILGERYAQKILKYIYHKEYTPVQR